MRTCAGALLVRENRILLAKRSADRDFYPGVWDVIGGYCESDEAPVDALARELVEEIGVTPRAFERIAVLAEPHPAEHGEAEYHIFVVTAWGDGEPRLRGPEHSELRWLSLDQALALPLAHPAYRSTLEAHGVVLVSEWRAEERHDAVAHHLVDCSLVAVDCLHHPLDDRIEDLARLLGITSGEQLHRGLQVGEQHGDELAFTFEGALGGENLLGKVFWGVRHRRGEHHRRRGRGHHG